MWSASEVPSSGEKAQELKELELGRPDLRVKSDLEINTPPPEVYTHQSYTECNTRCYTGYVV